MRHICIFLRPFETRLWGLRGVRSRLLLCESRICAGPDVQVGGVTSWVSVGAPSRVFLRNRVGYESELRRCACSAIQKHTDHTFLHFGDGPVLPVITTRRRVSPVAFSHKRVARHGHAHSATDASHGRLRVPMVHITFI